MSVVESLSNYARQQSLMDQALHMGGAKVTLASQREATRLRFQCYRFRSLCRELSRRTLEPGDPARGTSVYDPLVITLEGRSLIFTIESNEPLQVQPLGGA